MDFENYRLEIGHLSPQLKHLLTYLESIQSKEEFSRFLNEVKTLHGHYQEQLSHHAPGATRAIAAQDLIEGEIARTDSKDVTCKKGCAACCHFSVEVTADEAELLAILVNEGVTIDHSRLQLLANQDRQTEIPLPLKAENRCLFLSDEDACRIYHFRPMVCRKCQVISPPEECSKEEGQVVSQYIPVAEVILSAVVGLKGNNITSLAKALQKALSNTEKRLG